VQQEEAHLFSIRPVTGSRYPLPGWVESAGNAVFRGENPPAGALITWHVRRYTGDEVGLAITNAAGQPVANLKAPGTAGFGRVTWDLRPTKDLLTQYGGEGPDKLVPPGEYTVTLTVGKVKQSQKVQVSVAAGLETR
jgi:hypothetical protein